MNDTVRFREIAFSMPEHQLNILKSAAMSGDQGRALVMCKLYYPQMTAVEAEKFMNWLKGNEHR